MFATQEGSSLQGQQGQRFARGFEYLGECQPAA